MTRGEAARVLKNIWTRYISTFDDIESEEVDALDTAITALREKAERERGWGCAYCVIGCRSPDARYCSRCGRQITQQIGDNSHNAPIIPDNADLG